MFNNKLLFIAYLVFTCLNSFTFSEELEENKYEHSGDLKKCCLKNENVRKGQDGSLECTSSLTTKAKYVWNSNRFIHSGFPSCEYRVLSNENYKWFRYFSKPEVGLVYLYYEAWLEVNDSYCIDTYADTSYDLSLTKDKTELEKTKTELIAFCGLKDLRNYFTHVGINLFFLMGSALLNAATITIYIVVRKINHSRDWLQFAIFVAEFSAHVSYTLMIVVDTYVLLWKDSLKYVTFTVYYISYYMYTVKFTLVIATSVDLFLCVWRPYSGVNKSSRTKRNIRAAIMCYTLPALAPVLTNLYDYIIMGGEKVYMDSSARLLDGVPKSYLLFNQVIYMVQFGINLVIAIITSILIHRQRNKARILDDKKVQMRIQYIQESFVVYIKLVCATEIPFFISFILVHSQILGSASSIWNTSARGMYLISALYVFVAFGCSKSHKQYIKKMYESTVSW